MEINEKLIEIGLYVVIALYAGIVVLPVSHKTTKSLAWVVVNPVAKFVVLFALYFLAFYSVPITLLLCVVIAVIDYDMSVATKKLRQSSV